MGFFSRIGRALTSPFRKRKQKPKRRPEVEPTQAPEIEADELGRFRTEAEDIIESGGSEPGSPYRIVDYQDVNGTWRNTDPVGQVTTDGSRTGQGDDPPTTEDIESSPWVNVGFQDDDGEWYYKWIQGPFDAEFWIDDAIEQIVGEYGIAYGSAQ